MNRRKEGIKKGNGFLKSQGNLLILDRFYEYLSGKMPLPDILIIGKDCKNNHGINGKTVRRRTKQGYQGRCLRCEREKDIRAKEKKFKDKKLSLRHMDAMNLYEEQNNKPDDLFLI